MESGRLERTLSRFYEQKKHWLQKKIASRVSVKAKLPNTNLFKFET